MTGPQEEREPLASLPAGSIGGLGGALNAAKRLYACEPIVLERSKSGKPLPDKSITPAGAIVS